MGDGGRTPGEGRRGRGPARRARLCAERSPSLAPSPAPLDGSGARGQLTEPLQSCRRQNFCANCICLPLLKCSTLLSCKWVRERPQRLSQGSQARPFQGRLTTIIAAIISPYYSPRRQKVNKTLLRRERERKGGRRHHRPKWSAGPLFAAPPCSLAGLLLQIIPILPLSPMWEEGVPTKGHGGRQTMF